MLSPILSGLNSSTSSVVPWRTSATNSCPVSNDSGISPGGLASASALVFGLVFGLASDLAAGGDFFLVLLFTSTTGAGLASPTTPVSVFVLLPARLAPALVPPSGLALFPRPLTVLEPPPSFFVVVGLLIARTSLVWETSLSMLS